MATPRPPVEPVTSAVRPASRLTVWTHGSTGTLSKMDLQVQKLTAKGQATRQRIIEGAAAEIRERGVAVATLDDIRARTQTSKSQLFHYFPDGKEQLLLAVAEHEAQMVLDDQQPYLGELTSWAAWQRWRDAVVDRYRATGPALPARRADVGDRPQHARRSGGHLGADAQVARRDRGRRAAHAGAGQGRRSRLDADRVAAALLAGIQGGVGVMLADRRPRVISKRRSTSGSSHCAPRNNTG